MGSFVSVDLNGLFIDGAAFRWDVSDLLPTYVGVHTNPDAVEGQGGWVIYKFIYSGSSKTQGEKRVGTWTGRASLPWTI